MPPRELRPAVRAFLSRKDVWQWTHDYVKRRVPANACEHVAQDALVEATENATWPDSDEEKLLWATLNTVTDRAIADHLDRRKRRRKYEGDMPADPTVQDEAGDYVPDEEKDRDPSHDPRPTNPRVEGVLLLRFLASAVKGRPRDEETLRWMVACSNDDKTLEQISRETGIPLGTVHWRVDRFKDTYVPRYERWRNRAIILVVLLLGGWLVWHFLLRPRPDEIRPSPDFPWPPPSASSSAPVLPPPPPSFDNALPTQPPEGPQPLK